MAPPDPCRARTPLIALAVVALAACGQDTASPIPPATPSLQTTSTSAVLVGTGDVAACESQDDEATALLLDQIEGTVFTTGDNAYPDGSSSDFANCYEPSWGRHKARTRPTPGDHDYHTRKAAAYFDYFGSNAGDPRKGYYSYDLASWHVVVLNSLLPLHAGSTQERWLRSDLKKNTHACTLAYWHHPLFSSGKHGGYSFVSPAWDALYEAGVEVVLAGNDHSYERFAPQTPSGAADPERGVRQFVVGTGGKSLYNFTTVLPNSEVQYNATAGVLKLTLEENGYAWEFIPVSGDFRDSGTGTCH